MINSSSMMRFVRPLWRASHHFEAVRCYTLGQKFDASKRLTLSKIVATIGPASENFPVLPAVIDAGMRIMRINFSHASYEEADLRYNNLARCVGINHSGIVCSDNFAHRKGRNNMRAVMLDTQGPEIRTGSFGNGVKEVELTTGDKLVLTTDAAFRSNQTQSLVWISYKNLTETATPGSRILVDDGSIELEVLEKRSQAGSTEQFELVCNVVNSGSLGNKKGVNIPGRSVDLPAMSDKDVQDLKWGVKNDVDYIAASFIRKAQDVIDIRAKLIKLRELVFPLLSDSELEEHHPLALIISKIESTEGLDNFDEILAVSDGIMVARGDLGVEIPMDILANCQKEIVRRCNIAGKPVVVATEMLNSMQKNPRPTRAECLDVSNAILDGADCTMLSGESAKGKYPVQSIAMMQALIHQTELGMAAAAVDREKKNGGRVVRRVGTSPSAGLSSCRSAVAFSAVQLAHSTADVRAILVSCIAPSMAQQRNSLRELAGQLARFRPDVPVLCVVPDHKTGRMLQFHRGVHPVLMPPMASTPVLEALGDLVVEDEQLSEDNHMGRVLARLTQLQLLGAGDKVVMITSTNENNLDFSYILDIP